MAVAPVCLPVQAAHTSGLFVPVGPHVAVGVVLVPSRRPGFFGCMRRHLLDEKGIVIIILRNIGDNATAAQLRGFGRIAEGFAVRAFAAKHGGFVILPVTLAETKATILGPEEEPDAGQHKTGGEKCKQCEDAAVVDVVRVKTAGTRWGMLLWRSGRAGVNVRVYLEGRQIRGTLWHERAEWV